MKEEVHFESMPLIQFMKSYTSDSQSITRTSGEDVGKDDCEA
jgi:hypothetical protein